MTVHIILFPTVMFQVHFIPLFNSRLRCHMYSSINIQKFTNKCFHFSRCVSMHLNAKQIYYRTIAHLNATVRTRIHVTIFGNNLNKENDPTHTNFQKFLQTRTQNERICIFSAKILEERCHHPHL